MSTESIRMANSIHEESLKEFINEENLDMLDEFSAQQIANVVIYMADNFKHGSKVVQMPLFSKTANKGYFLKVNNNHQGFVSVSDIGQTGVSRTEYYPFFTDEDEGDFAGLCSLAQMINEAWYSCVN